MTPTADTLTRRGFLLAAARAAAAAALVGLGLDWLLRRRSPHNPAAGPAQTCVNSGVCRGCTVLARCGLPAALSARRAGAQGGPAHGR